MIQGTTKALSWEWKIAAENDNKKLQCTGALRSCQPSEKEEFMKLGNIHEQKCFTSHLKNLWEDSLNVLTLTSKTPYRQACIPNFAINPQWKPVCIWCRWWSMCRDHRNFYFISDRIEDRSTRRELEKKETLGSLPWCQNLVKESTEKNPNKMARSWSSTHTQRHTHTCKYVFRRREEKSSYTLPFTLLYNIAIIVVVVIIHARNARKSECGNNGHGVEETAAFPSDYTWRLPSFLAHAGCQTIRGGLKSACHFGLVRTCFFFIFFFLVSPQIWQFAWKPNWEDSVVSWPPSPYHTSSTARVLTVYLMRTLKRFKIHWATPEGS